MMNQAVAGTKLRESLVAGRQNLEKFKLEKEQFEIEGALVRNDIGLQAEAEKQQRAKTAA